MENGKRGVGAPPAIVGTDDVTWSFAYNITNAYIEEVIRRKGEIQAEVEREVSRAVSRAVKRVARRIGVNDLGFS